MHRRRLRLHHTAAPGQLDGHGLAAGGLEQGLDLFYGVHLPAVDMGDDVSGPQPALPGRGLISVLRGHIRQSHHHDAPGKQLDAHGVTHRDHILPLLAKALCRFTCPAPVQGGGGQRAHQRQAEHHRRQPDPPWLCLLLFHNFPPILFRILSFSLSRAKTAPCYYVSKSAKLFWQSQTTLGTFCRSL